ncbi:MAG TPA: hypothetical protein VGO43_00900 [Pyrinomonadaceae bacterium]|nr:hypothetical protein [Pyrinomonadaceae bacterium]
MVVHSLRILTIAAIAALGAFPAAAQKGIDTQTQKIKEEGNKTTSRTNDVGRSFDWGAGKTKVRNRMDNPYKLNGRRDVLLSAIVDVLREQKIVVDDASSRMKDGIIVTQPFVFAKGSVITLNELNHYAVLDYADTAWTRAQYTLTIEIQSIDGVHNSVSVNAKVEGRAGNGLMSEWRTVQSSGLAEDEFLAKLVEAVTGTSPDVSGDTDH